MDIRKATLKDVPRIVELLKLSLGESLMPKSEELWKWKHLSNPFGPSNVLLAFDGDRLIGVRALMRWEWRLGNELIKSIRAVDTATHPEYQGKGIFSKLTGQLVKERMEDGDSFIFNTPNEKSKPGYLKLGWKEIGKLPLKISLRYGNSSLGENRLITTWEDFLVSKEINQLFSIETSAITTNYSANYLKWRYYLNPLIKYGIIAGFDPTAFLIVYRVKRARNVQELRLVECLGNVEVGIPYLLRNKGINLITVSGFCKDLTLKDFFFRFQLGPVVTVRDLNLTNSINQINFGNWNPSLGDLEFF